MEKIKNMLSGGSKDDEVKHGDDAHTAGTSTATGTTAAHHHDHSNVAGAGHSSTTDSGSYSASTTHPDTAKKEHGILRQIFNPAGDKYDEEAFGTSTGNEAASSSLAASSTTDQGRNASVVGAQDLGQLRTDPEAAKNEPGILRQIINPHGGKYDEEAFGATATEVGASGLPEHDGKGPGELYTDPAYENKDRGVLRQILNPGGEKYDETRYGTTAQANAPLGMATSGTPASQIPPLPAKIESTDAAHDDRGVARQLLNPGGDRHDAMRYGETGTVAAGSEQGTTAGTSHLGRDAALGGAAVTGLGAAGYEANKYHDAPASGSTYPETSGTSDRSFPLSGGATTTGSSTYPANTGSTSTTGAESGTLFGGSAIPDRTAQTSSTNDSHLGRDAAIATGVGAGAGAVASHEHSQARDSTLPNIDRSSAFGNEPLLGSAGTTGTTGVTSNSASYPTGNSSIAPASSTAYSGNNEAITSSGATAGLASSTGVAPGTTDSSHLGRNAAIGAGAGAVGGAGIAEYERSQHPTMASSFADSAVGGHHDNETPDVGYVHHTHGPHSTDAANRLDPHVPGEFPTATGEDRHKRENREAAIIGGTGLGAADLSNLARDEPSLGSSGTGSSAPAAASTSTAPLGQSAMDSHLGRDTAVGAGTGLGAAGLGTAGYEATRAGDQPSQSFTGNPSASTTTANPLATSSAAPIQSEQQPSHYGRDAALAGGAGATGAGAYEAVTHHDHTDDSSAAGHNHSKLHKKEDPRGPTGASNVMHDRHEHKLEDAREAEAAKHHEHDSHEKKPSLIQRILHPGQHKHDNDTAEDTSSATGMSSSTSAHHGEGSVRTPTVNDPDQRASSSTVTDSAGTQ